MKNKGLTSNQDREKFSSRLGFILISAGCAIGLGNVYRFPITTGAYGGGFFVLMYLLFLVILGIPVMTCELTVGRASQRSIVSSFHVLQQGKPKSQQKWGFMRYIGFAGNYLLMMFYTIITGWMCVYFIKYLTGSIGTSTDPAVLGDLFGSLVTNAGINVAATVVVIFIGFGVCAIGLKNGVERITKYMMVALLALLVGLAVYSCTLSGAGEGISFYLIPSAERLSEAGFFKTVTSAMGQAFFTLSIGIGSIAIFGSYIDKERKLTGEAITIASLDTFVALVAGLIIFPACYTFNGGQTANADNVGAGFLFTTLSATFNSMGPVAGRIIGALFFLFMMFAAFSTVIAVFENIVSFWKELTPLKRWQICLINFFLMSVLTLPAIFGNGLLSNITIGGKGIMDMEDFVLSNLLLPFGSMVYVLFCTSKYGWGYQNFLVEVNTGKGLQFKKGLRIYMSYVLPVIIMAVFVLSLLSYFGVIK